MNRMFLFMAAIGTLLCVHGFSQRVNYDRDPLTKTTLDKWKYALLESDKSEPPGLSFKPFALAYLNTGRFPNLVEQEKFHGGQYKYGIFLLHNPAIMKPALLKKTGQSLLY